MNESNNRELMQTIFTALSNGDDSPFINAMADDVQWIWMGSGQWSKTFSGKHKVLGELWSAVRQTLKPPYKVIAQNIIADGDYVAIEAIGQNSTPQGKVYNNKYCWICKIIDNKIHELKEYMDTDLVTKTFTEQHQNVIGQKFLFDFGMAKAILYLQSESLLHFTIIEKDGAPCKEEEIVNVTLSEIRPNLYQVSWREKNQNTVTQLQDFDNRIVYSTWMLPNGEVITRTGTIVLLSVSA